MVIVPLSDSWLFFLPETTSCTEDIVVDYFFVGEGEE